MIRCTVLRNGRRVSEEQLKHQQFQKDLQPVRMMNRHKREMLSRAKAAVLGGRIREEANQFRQKIFAPRLKPQEVQAFRPPHFEKTPDEQEFLRTALADNFLFGSLSDESLCHLVDSFEKIEVHQNQCIIQQGDKGDYFYILQMGKLSFHVNDKIVGTAKVGTGFGELALLYSAPRAASAYADTDCTLFRLDQFTFRNLVQTQRQNSENQMLEIIKTVPLFENLEYFHLVRLVRAMQHVTFCKGDYLLRKGQEADAFLVVQNGQLHATDIVIGGSKYEDQIFGQGDYFGWRSIVYNEPTYGNVQALEDGSVLLIDSNTFLEIFGSIKQLVLKATGARFLASLAVIRDSCLDPSLIADLADLMEDVILPPGYVIAKQDEETEAALYAIREGKVKVESSLDDECYNRVVTGGGYFGEDQLLLDHVLLGVGRPVLRSKYTVTVLEGDCTLAVLKLGDCRKILNTSMLGLGKDPATSPIDASIHYDDLTRHVMLGAGSFGQVWLVSKDNGENETHQVFALKVQSKHQLIESNQAEGVVSERNIMARLNDPFVISLLNSYQDQHRVFMLTGLLQGGELEGLIYSSEYNGLDEEDAKFYASCILEGLAFMHRRKIIHRDLKPQNVMINEKGYGVIIDLGFAKYVPGKTYTFCGTLLYIAPEVVCYSGHDMGADHWSLACMIYEMCNGFTPFWRPEMDEMTLLKRIVRGQFQVSGYMSVELKELMVRMLVPNPAKRLGSLAGGVKDVYDAPWFSSVDFERLRKQEIEAPWVPDINDPLDSSNFHDCSDLQDKFEVEEPELSDEQQAVFKSFGDTV